MPILGAGIDGGPSLMTHDDLVARLRSDSVTLQRYGATTSADAVEHCADLLEEVNREVDDERLTLARGASEGGYSKSHLGRLLADKKIPNAGHKGAPRIRRADLPRKPSRQPTGTGGALREVLRGYEGSSTASRRR